MKDKFKDKKVLLSLIIALAFFLTIGIAYAYFSIVVQGNEDAKQVKVSTSTLSILYTDGPEIIATEIFPGASYTKTFTVTNTGTESVDFDILMSEMVNTIERGELQYSLECHAYKNYNETSQEDFGTCEGINNTSLTNAGYQKLKEKTPIDVDVTNVYTLKVEFINKDEPQNYNQGKKFNGKIQINEYKASSLKEKILADNMVYRDDVASEYVSASTGIDFKSRSSLTNGQGIYTNNKLEDGKNYYFRGGSFCAYEGYLEETYDGTKCTAAGGTWSNYKCSFDLSKEACAGHGEWNELNNNVSFGGFIWKIIRIDENGEVRLLYNGKANNLEGEESLPVIGTAKYSNSYKDNAYLGYMQPYNIYERVVEDINFPQDADSYKMSKTYTLDDTTGMFNLAGTIVDGTFTEEYKGYYMCMSDTTIGQETMCEYLARIEEVSNDGTNNILTKATSLEILQDQGVFTTSKEQAQSNEVSSPVKALNDNWYKENLISVSDKISKEAGYCNDRSIASGYGYGSYETHYVAAARVSEGTPTYKCSNESNDLFTTSEATNGNKKLIYPVGLITADELVYAGSNGDNASQVYTCSSIPYWTMTPDCKDIWVEIPGTFIISNGTFSGVTATAGWVDKASVRPVITLTSEALVTSGDGSLASPYIVE